MKTNSLYPIIVSDNPEKTIEFYKVLGFEKKHDNVTLKGNHVYVLCNGDMEIEVIEQSKAGPMDMPVGMYGMRMNVKDIDEAYKELSENGCTIVTPPFETGVGKNMIIKDTNGVNITIIQHIKKQ